MKRDLRFSFLRGSLHSLMRPPSSSFSSSSWSPSFRLFSSSFTICSLLPPLTSNSTSRIHCSVCAINPNNFELESLSTSNFPLPTHLSFYRPLLSPSLSLALVHVSSFILTVIDQCFTEEKNLDQVAHRVFTIRRRGKENSNSYRNQSNM